jgi:hypothetical protein
MLMSENGIEIGRPALSLGEGIHSVKSLKEKSLEKILRQSAGKHAI